MLSFIKTRPPLIIFFLCLLTLAITIFCFAFYIKNTDPVPDSDRNHDWLTLMKHFNSLDICLEENSSSSKGIDNDFIEMTTVQALVSVNNSDLIRKFTNVKGFLTLEGWHTDCPKNYVKPSHLQVYFDIPDIAKSNVTEFDTCVIIQGPEEYLPKFFAPNCEASVTENEKKLEAYLSSMKPQYSEFCKNGLTTKLKFHRQDKANFANFLSDNEKSLIYVHLLWTSYFIVFILLIILIYATIQSEHVFDKYLQKFVPRSQR